jgi:exosome complex RNA-binding protein Rrp4
MIHKSSATTDFASRILHLAMVIDCVQNGSIVYARVTLANKDMDPEIVCTNAGGKSAGFGELKGGMWQLVSSHERTNRIESISDDGALVR